VDAEVSFAAGRWHLVLLACSFSRSPLFLIFLDFTYCM